jgi:hypothetical protein
MANMLPWQAHGPQARFHPTRPPDERTRAGRASAERLFGQPLPRSSSLSGCLREVQDGRGEAAERQGGAGAGDGLEAPLEVAGTAVRWRYA